jgi:superfamily I DNA/RNA helicase
MSHKTDWLKGLNPEQARAVTHDYGPLLILAGAGSGKTTVLVARTGRLIAEGIADPQQICVLTFTNKAAKELKHRVGLKVGKAAAKIWAGTFHSFGLHLLRKYHRQAKLSRHFGVIDGSDCQALVKELMQNTKIVGKDKFDTEKLLSMVNDIRSRGGPKLSGPTDEYDEMAEIIAPKFSRKLELLGVVDFEGLLLKPLQLMKEHPEVLAEVQSQFTHMMVDEFQDTNLIQMDLINRIVAPHKNLAVVGDDDQSIYGWRGACVSNILDFPKNYKGSEVIRLERNYRSTPAILELANESIKKNEKRHGKILRSEGSKDTGEKPELFVLENEDSEAEFVVDQIRFFKEQGYHHKEVAILYRSNSQGGLIESYLRRANIPYAVSGGTSFFDRKEIKDILSYMRCSFSPHDVAFRRIVNSPSRGIGDVTIEKLIEHCEHQKISFYEAAKEWRKVGSGGGRVSESASSQSEDSPLADESSNGDIFTHANIDQGESSTQAPRVSTDGIQIKSGESIDRLFKFLKELPNKLLSATNGAYGDALVNAFTELGYKEYVYQTAGDPAVAEKKWQLVEIFGRVFESSIFKNGPTEASIKSFVDSMELRDDVIDSEEEKDEVQLLTFHACKGLEFPVCLMVGLEEDIIPHRTLGLDIDEERRLFYVGVTRAQKRLVLSRCQQRRRHGSLKPSSPSRFVVEIPTHLVKEFPYGNRPVTAEEKEDLVSSFLASLASKPSVKI